MKILIICLAIFISASTFTGCTRRVIIQGPPPPRVEYIPVAPSPMHVWVKGYYYQRHNHYYWRPGHYAVGHRRPTRRY
jgi:hypothetical protein